MQLCCTWLTNKLAACSLSALSVSSSTIIQIFTFTMHRSAMTLLIKSLDNVEDNCWLSLMTYDIQLFSYYSCKLPIILVEKNPTNRSQNYSSIIHTGLTKSSYLHRVTINDVATFIQKSYIATCNNYNQ